MLGPSGELVSDSTEGLLDTSPPLRPGTSALEATTGIHGEQVVLALSSSPTCEQCGRSFKTRQGLASHLRFKHAGPQSPASRRMEVTPKSPVSGFEAWSEAASAQAGAEITPNSPNQAPRGLASHVRLKHSEPQLRAQREERASTNQFLAVVVTGFMVGAAAGWANESATADRFISAILFGFLGAVFGPLAAGVLLSLLGRADKD